MIGMSALRLTLPYHQQRKPAELERADHLVSTNIGRTIQSMRQAVLDTRAAVRWLKMQGYERVGILGTSVGSCIAFLTFAHEPDLNAGAFNHVSGYVADVVWKGLSTEHVRAGFGNSVTLEELRTYWAPISPLAVHVARCRHGPPAVAFHRGSLRSDVSDRSLSRSHWRGPAAPVTARYRLASVRPLHHGRDAVESDRCVENRVVLPQTLPRIELSSSLGA